MKRTLYQSACVALPKGLGGVLNIVLNGLLLTRMAPAEYGVYALCVLLVTLTDGVLGAAIDLGAVKLASVRRLHDPRAAAAAEQWAALIKMGLLLALLVLLLPVMSALSKALFQRHDAALLILALTVAAGVLMLRSIATHLQLAQRFTAYAAFELLAQAWRVGGIVAVLLWAEVSAWTLMLAALGATLLTLLGGVQLAGLRWPGVSWRWSDGRELLRALRWMVLTFALSSLYARLDLLLLTQWSSIDQVGLFAAAQVFATVPELFGMWLAVVFSPRVAPAQANWTLRRLMLQVQSSVGLCAVVGGCGVWWLLHWQPAWLPASYAQAADVLLPLLLGSVVSMLAMPVTVPFLMFTRPRFIVQYDLLSAPVLLLVYHLAITHWGAVGAAWVSGCARVLKALVLLVYAWSWAQRVRAPKLTVSP